jgi:hypothetical protein
MAGAMLLALAAPCLIHPQSTNDSSQRVTRRELLKSAIATATVRIAKEEAEAMEQRQHRFTPAFSMTK